MMLLGNINAIPFRRRFGGGGGMPFPYIPGMIARYSGAGLTNEDMSTNPVWKDLTGNGHDLQMKNFAWGGMSGVGGVSTYYDKYEFTPDKYYMVAVSSGTQHAQFTFKVTGLVDGNTLSLADTSSPSNIYGKWTQDGIYTVDIDVINTDRSLYFYNGVSAIRGTFTIEILPLYPGALVFDGVDDYGICENFPILTKKKGYTVVALRQWLTPQTKTNNEVLISNLENEPKWSIFNLGAFQFEIKYNVTKTVQTDNFGKSSNVAMGSSPLSYQTSNSYNGSSIISGNVNSGGNFLTVGCGGDGFYSNVAIWELVILDHDATEEELTKIKDYFVKTYPWLFPDQAWTVTGKTNEDTDRATIANITGNGNNLVLSNFGFAENSGYGLYYQYFGNGFKTTNGEIIGGSWNKINNYNISCNIRMPINSIGKCFWDRSVLTTGIKLRFKLTGMAEGDVLAFGYTNVYDLTYTSDGIYIIELPPIDKSCGFSLQSSLTENLPTTQVTIELLPFDYEGYLVTDAVDDRIASSAFTMGKDFTVVGEWKMLKNSDTYELAGISKIYSFVIYNYSYLNRVNVYIHNPQGTAFITDTIKAFTSQGNLYIDFNNTEQVVTKDSGDLGYSLNIGHNGTNYTKIAFKNLSIFPKVLSKEDCIKAYIYLQTLKAK